MRKPLLIIIMTISVALISSHFDPGRDQTLSITIFLLFIFSTLLFWKFRLAFTFPGTTALFAAGLAMLIDHRNAKSLTTTSVDWWTLCFFAF